MPDMNRGHWSSPNVARKQWAGTPKRLPAVEIGGGGGNDGLMEARVAVLEEKVGRIASAVERIEAEAHDNFKWMLGGFATLLLAVTGTTVGIVTSLRAEYRDVATVQTASMQASGAANVATLAANTAVLQQIQQFQAIKAAGPAPLDASQPRAPKP